MALKAEGWDKGDRKVQGADQRWKKYPQVSMPPPLEGVASGDA